MRNGDGRDGIMTKRARSALVAIMMLALASASAMAASSAPAAAPTFTAPAQPSTPANAPDPATNHTLADFMKTGVKVYYMGFQLGLHSWFLIKDNQVQIVYTSPDNQNAIVGVMFNAQGDNVTSQQVKTLYDTNKDVNAQLSNLNAQHDAMLPPVVPSLANSSLVPQASPGERLMQALQNAAGVNIGAPMAPKIFMVADPYCPHCQATWRGIRNAVFGGKLQVRLVPVDAISPDSERAAAQFLRSPDPLNAWDKYIAGDQSQLAGTPDTASVQAVESNHMLIESWHIQETPFIVYRAKDGQIKIEQGQPDQVASIIDDVAP
jgi:thiol:disulfide interchange protein DsbG